MTNRSKQFLNNYIIYEFKGLDIEKFEKIFHRFS